MNDTQRQWERCIDFHGHRCKGLLAGFLASAYAMSLIDFDSNTDEDAVCISENDACGIDAIQVVLGCTAGRGSLLFHMTGKTAYSFYGRKSSQNCRIILKGELPDPGGDIEGYCDPGFLSRLFDAGPARIPLPERARIFDTYRCDDCGELAGANWIHIQNGRKLCADCYDRYDRFHV